MRGRVRVRCAAHAGIGIGAGADCCECIGFGCWLARTHSDEKPFQCRWRGCRRSFKDASNTKRHEASHLGFKPFMCYISGCGSSFTRKASMLVHLVSVHKVELHSDDAAHGNFVNSLVNGVGQQQLNRIVELAIANQDSAGRPAAADAAAAAAAAVAVAVAVAAAAAAASGGSGVGVRGGGGGGGGGGHRPTVDDDAG
jgi:hypothetical protein